VIIKYYGKALVEENIVATIDYYSKIIAVGRTLTIRLGFSSI
jgi:hypothetical protein